jgi:hypothetical protein
MSAEGCAVSIAAEGAQACHDDKVLVVLTFDQQMSAPGLHDDLVVAQQVAQCALQFAGMMFGG